MLGREARTPTVVVVGAGCAGTLTAVGLLRTAGPRRLRVVLVERSGRFGPGVAYSTGDERHLLNVVAERMSAFPAEPGHFAAWARRAGREVGPGSFLPRALYGHYLRDLLTEAEREAPAGRTLERVRGEVVAVEPAAAGATVVLADGGRIDAAHVVLALGGLGGAPPVALPDDPRIVRDPWAAGALARPVAGTTLLIGSGLTAVDVALTVGAHGPASRVLAVSRGGCLPFEQLPGLREPVSAPAPPAAPATLAALERWLSAHVARSRRAGHDWRDVLDGIRPHTQQLWHALPVPERRRFVRERSRAWELRRHRMAPEIAAQVRALLHSGRLLVRAGRIVAVRALEETVEVLVRAGREEALRTLRVGRVVLCAGAGTDVTRSESPLLAALLDRGLAAPDALGLGLRATADGLLLGADGAPRRGIHLLGPLRRGELWETTAVGEIRVQAQTVAAAVARDLATR